MILIIDFRLQPGNYQHANDKNPHLFNRNENLRLIHGRFSIFLFSRAVLLDMCWHQRKFAEFKMADGHFERLCD